ncbi:MAG TPA: PTS sugar transporter subunit IIA [Candidatus Saccharimonadales bacterium]|nr:PTS sugar transporter subunit IIA [Candidatus Saccharimonadales bacterium]
MLSELLNLQAIRIPLQARTKDDAIRELVELLEAAHGLHTDGDILSRVVRRESMMSTGIGNGVAIPHGKSRLVERLVAACAVAAGGLDFDAVDGEPATLFILLVSPENVRGPHVKALANISRLMKEEAVRESLRGAASPEAFMQALREAESRFL